MENNLVNGIKKFAEGMVKYPNLSPVIHLQEYELEQLLKELLEPHLENHEIQEIRRDIGKINIKLKSKEI